ncbi:toxin-antitoxin system YwqK family antitoxin [Polaromonas sp. UC242_47]|uniref:toxin-antitoxin system YwqK family antitoxin n=1 Tax=Polaromonas sp. UC242_47 TaxID=3374626 RepID=UPI00378BD682
MSEGAVVRRSQYRQGLLEGEAMDYDREGALVQKASYRKNLLEGSLTRYWPDGQVMEVLLYRAGKPVGKPQRFDSKGVELRDDEAKTSLMKRLEKLVKG